MVGAKLTGHWEGGRIKGGRGEVQTNNFFRRGPISTIPGPVLASYSYKLKILERMTMYVQLGGSLYLLWPGLHSMVVCVVIEEEVQQAEKEL